MQSEAVQIAVVGAGGWGKNHVRNFIALEDAWLRYVCDRSSAVRDRMSAEYPAVEFVDDLAPVIADEAIQALIIATDAPSHFKLALQALQAGKDVFVEKPLCLSAREAAQLCEEADKRERILMVGHLLLYHPAVELLKEVIDSGELGRIHYIYAQRLNLGVVRKDENAWWSLAPHDISVANYLLGEAPDAVSASGSAFLQQDRGIEDVVFATLYYPDARMAHIHVSWLDPHKTRKITIVGDRRMAVFNDTSADQKLMIFDKGVEPPSSLSYEQGVRIRTGDIRIPALQMSEPLRHECQSFIDAVRSRRKPVADGNSGVEVVRALEAGAKSLAAGGTRISTKEEG